MPMTWDQISANWEQRTKASALARWPALASSPMKIDGSKDSLVGALKGLDFHPQEAEHQVDDWRQSLELKEGDVTQAKPAPASHSGTQSQGEHSGKSSHK